MFEEAARLMRQMDDVLDNTSLNPKTRVQIVFNLSRQVWDAIRPYYIEHNWTKSPWEEVDRALGVEPLRNETKINEVLEIEASGGFPAWCFEWWRKGGVSPTLIPHLVVSDDALTSTQHEQPRDAVLQLCAEDETVPPEWRDASVTETRPQKRTGDLS